MAVLPLFQRVPRAADVLGLGADIAEQAAAVVREALRASIYGRNKLESLGRCGGLKLHLVGPDGPRAAATNADVAWLLDEAPIGVGPFGVADGASCELGMAVFGDGWMGWIGGGLARTARPGPSRS